MTRRLLRGDDLCRWIFGNSGGHTMRCYQRVEEWLGAKKHNARHGAMFRLALCIITHCTEGEVLQGSRQFTILRLLIEAFPVRMRQYKDMRAMLLQAALEHGHTDLANWIGS
jgi:hypothetical protein